VILSVKSALQINFTPVSSPCLIITHHSPCRNASHPFFCLVSSSLPFSHLIPSIVLSPHLSSSCLFSLLVFCTLLFFHVSCLTSFNFAVTSAHVFSCLHFSPSLFSLSHYSCLDVSLNIFSHLVSCLFFLISSLLSSGLFSRLFTYFTSSPRFAWYCLLISSLPPPCVVSWPHHY